MDLRFIPEDFNNASDISRIWFRRLDIVYVQWSPTRWVELFVSSNGGWTDHFPSLLFYFSLTVRFLFHFTTTTLFLSLCVCCILLLDFLSGFLSSECMLLKDRSFTWRIHGSAAASVPFTTLCCCRGWRCTISFLFLFFWIFAYILANPFGISCFWCFIGISDVLFLAFPLLMLYLWPF